MTQRGAEWRAVACVKRSNPTELLFVDLSLPLGEDWADDGQTFEVVVTPEPLAAARARVVEALRNRWREMGECGVCDCAVEHDEGCALDALDALAREEN